MSINHHVLAKVTTDEVLGKFKKAEWKYANSYGKDFFRICVVADFPSPDAMFYDPANKVIASFEFKPPTETKRGILTGVGQSVAYLQCSDISFLIAPVMLGDFRLGDYLTNLYKKRIAGKIPTGLILYNDNNPSEVTLAQNAENISDARIGRNISRADRFWAKHQDLPIPLFHLILHYYYLKSTRIVTGDPFAACWLERMISKTVADDFQTAPVHDLSGEVIMTMSGNKQLVFLEKTIAGLKGTQGEKRRAIKSKIDTKHSGDNYYKSIRKNFLSFIKHLQMIDSENFLTDSGFKLYHLGLINGPTSKTFTDYFTKELLTTGHHLDLILDFGALMQKEPSADVGDIINKMEDEYEQKGYIRRNPGRKQSAASKVNFLKYERILWKALGLIDADHVIQWRRITEICSLPEL